MIAAQALLAATQAANYPDSGSLATRILIPSIAALLGAMFGALFSRGIPGSWSAPRLRIEVLDGHASFCRASINNVGRSAAKSTAARAAMLSVRNDDVVDLRTEPWVPPDRRLDPEPWFRSAEAFRRRGSVPAAAVASVDGSVHWAASGNPDDILIRPQLHELLNLAHFDGEYLRIASEDPRESRIILRATGRRVYRMNLIVSAENAKPCRCSLTFHVRGGVVRVTGRSGRRRLPSTVLRAPRDS